MAEKSNIRTDGWRWQSRESCVKGGEGVAQRELQRGKDQAYGNSEQVKAGGFRWSWEPSQWGRRGGAREREVIPARKPLRCSCLVCPQKT